MPDTRARRRFDLSKLMVSTQHYLAGALVTAPVALGAAAAYYLLRRRRRLAFLLACFGVAWMLHRRRQHRRAEKATIARRFRVAIVGSGFGGILAAIKLKQRGMDVRVFERESSLGGTWNLNTYPGSGCDIPSLYYCYSFFPARWSRKWALQPEILAYLRRAAQHFEVLPLISFNRAVTRVEWSEERRQYAVTTAATTAPAPVDGVEPDPLAHAGGPAAGVETDAGFDFVVVATGQLNIPALPNLRGVDTFGGGVGAHNGGSANGRYVRDGGGGGGGGGGDDANDVLLDPAFVDDARRDPKVAMHTARWDHSVSLKGKRVGVIGTGASAVQAVPEIAKDCASLTLFQRSGALCVPRGDFAYGPLTQAWFKFVPMAARLYRWSVYVLSELQWFLFFVTTQPKGGGAPRPNARNLLAAKMMAKGMFKQVKAAGGSDEKAQAVCPDPSQALGCKRVLISDAYLQAVARSNVRLVTDRIAEVTRAGVITARPSAPGDGDGDGNAAALALHELDVLVYATGFHATKFCSTLRVVGADLPPPSASTSAPASDGDAIPVGAEVRFVGMAAASGLDGVCGTVATATPDGEYTVRRHDRPRERAAVEHVRRRNLVRRAVLSEVWGDEPKAFLGIAAPRFPNMFFLYGPATNLGHSSIVFMMECQMDHILSVVDRVARSKGGKASRVEVKDQAMNSFYSDIREKLLHTVWTAGCKNWYLNDSGVVINNWAASCTEYWWATRPGASAVQTAYAVE